MKKICHTLFDMKVDKKVIDPLKELLADLQIFHTTIQTIQTTNSTVNFSPLKVKYEEMQDNIANGIHFILERIINLSGTAVLNFEDELSVSKKNSRAVSKNEHETAKLVINYLEDLIKKEDRIVQLALTENDYKTINLMKKLIDNQQTDSLILLTNLNLQKDTDFNKNTKKRLVLSYSE